MISIRSMAYEVPIVSARYARRFAKFLEGKGIGRQAILEGQEIDLAMLNDPDAFLSMNQVMRLLRQADSLVEDERIPFQFGQQLDLPAHGLLGFALLRQQDHRKLINMVVQYLRVCLPVMDLDLSSRGDEVLIQLRDTWELGELRPFMAKIYMGSIYSVAAPICRNFRFEFDFPTRLQDRDWRLVAPGAELRFGTSANRAVMPLAGRPVRNDDAGLSYFLAGMRSREEIKSDDVHEVVTQVREHVLNFPGRQSTLERTAQTLGMSARSLRRHLGMAGYSFREIRNEIRETFATRFLTDTSLPLDAIASKLGFSDQASFTRAYRAWTGSTPGDVRRQSREVSD
ncbi:AraC family transcriptional regulator ligand-binding domain-containing protein [Marinobacteraceae bacterium S3BR75-40.1]